jgi:probable HAF family extracellular repeat protein
MRDSEEQMQTRAYSLAVIVIDLCVATSLANGAEDFAFRGLGYLTGGVPDSGAYGISADGQVVVGYSSAAPGMIEAFRWTESSGMTGLGNLSPADRDSRAFGASADGAVVTGSGGFAEPVAFRWSESLGMVALGGNARRAYGVSSDGTTIVGERPAGGDSVAFRWTESGGLQSLGYLPHLPEFGPISSAHATSVDGTVVVGSSTSYSGQQAFRWTASDGMVGIGDLPGGITNSGARGVSADGTVIVGYGRSAAGAEAFRWTASSGMQGLGDLPGGTFSSIAVSVSADGSIIVGRGSTEVGSEAFVWDASHGLRNLRSVLAEEGLNLTGWLLSEATGISADGRKIVGWGVNPDGNNEAWLATISVPSSLPGDFNRDGTVDSLDFAIWRNGLGTIYTQDDYELWKLNYGRTASSGDGSGIGTPEPGSGILLLATIVTVGAIVGRVKIVGLSRCSIASYDPRPPSPGSRHAAYLPTAILVGREPIACCAPRGCCA